MSNGIVCYATKGQRYYKQASLLTKSVKANSPSTPICIFTDNKEWDGFKNADYTKHMDHPSSKVFSGKFSSILNSPFDRTLYLDADTYVVQDLNHVFEVLDRYDIGLTHGHCRAKRLDNVKNMQRFKNIPKAFTSIQGGFLLTKRTPLTTAFWTRVRNNYVGGNFFDDQMFIRQAAWNHKRVNFYFFPPEYNLFRVCDLEVSRRYVPYIVHYTTFKGNPEPVIKEKLGQLMDSQKVTFNKHRPIYE